MKLLSLLLLFPLLATAQYNLDVDRSVKLTAAVSASDITLNWIADPGVTGYTLYRRAYGAEDWGAPIAEYGPEVTTYLDEDTDPHTFYEYRVSKELENGTGGVGYLLSGHELPPVHEGGRLLIVVTATTFPEIETDLTDYRSVLDTDGWPSRLLIVDAAATAAEIRAEILAAHAESSFTSLLLFGDVPIAYSGEISPDGHRDHVGAWASDLYYGDLDGSWTDTLVDNATAADPVNHNIPGDGKLDQSYLPSDVELAVGRVDFRRLPAISEDEFTLLREYLRKDIDYRTHRIVPVRRAVVRNLNGWSGALGQSGIRAFSALVSPDSISYEEWAEVFDASYQFYYGAGNGGFPSAIKNPNSFRFNNRDFRAIFTSWFSSYVGDYGLENCYMKAALSSGTTLTAAWIGAPLAHQHAMAMGFPIGHVMRVSENNDGRYEPGLFARGIHLNLLGDPTLKAYVMAPPTDLLVTSDTGYVDLRWSAAENDPDRYYVYRRVAGDPAYVLLDSVMAPALTYTDSLSGESRRYDYLVRASRLEVTPAGSFRNLSAGAAATIDVTTGIQEGGSPATAELVVFPNPARTSITVRADREVRSLVLLDTNGRRLLARDGGNRQEMTLLIRDVPPGYYLLRVATDGAAQVRPVVIR